jgi:Pterin 4 alpha carbinolamine dehydratase
MNNPRKGLEHSALVMKIVGCGVIAFGAVGAVAAFIYTPGILWGRLPKGFPHIGPAHPTSPYEGLHPYAFMILSLYLAWAILLIRGAKDPKANAAPFDFTVTLWTHKIRGLHRNDFIMAAKIDSLT